MAEQILVDLIAQTFATLMTIVFAAIVARFVMNREPEKYNIPKALSTLLALSLSMNLYFFVIYMSFQLGNYA